MKTRNPQFALRLDTAAQDPDERWHEGAVLAYLGSALTLKLATDRKQARLEGQVLHLPLPPEASARQVRDAAEAWLRSEAKRILAATIARQAERQGCPLPILHLSFAARGSWAQSEAKGIRCHWRLIEQAPAVIEQVIARVVATLAHPMTTPDLFSLA
ncbi:YgjP-like metallopeptidase domain-containing protein [Denitratisoma oestradiolicum]|uniref:YgjP-like metallopeptidase domain-containing protein n=1 Tax=Denitratisoma oestradiolicum TaxID=311182 RepID=A0A6S6Y471_9PROT|nr:YgjP-like metallopeptidase domain-containing protein [Denitratisoma oestradiolicum]CAB1367408.1 conserved protein of unknown function [Denitratisoma oestradiolicum]